MRQHQQWIQLRTKGRGFHEITNEVREAVAQSGVETGLAVVHCAHTSCSLALQENHDPTARADLENWIERLAPDGDPRYTHTMEGPDDSPSHIRSMVMRTSETIPVANADLVLGAWQGIWLAEHRLTPHSRKILVHVMGE
jgi:secondary thiamine-phosphate synthase enzyme